MHIVIGHTAAYCYSISRPGYHPPVSHAECSLGLIRDSSRGSKKKKNDRSQLVQSICVDAGMIWGARAYLEISSSKSSEKLAHDDKEKQEEEDNTLPPMYIRSYQKYNSISYARSDPLWDQYTLSTDFTTKYC